MYWKGRTIIKIENKRINEKEMKKILIEMMDYLDDICKKNIISYSLGGGSLLGAIRHKGFIPWDDDVDIVLKREDYNRLIKLLRDTNHSEYILLDKSTKNYRYNYSKLCYVNSYHKSYTKDPKEMGVFIDIFPLDNIPDIDFDEKIFNTEITKMKKNINFSNFSVYNAGGNFLKSVIKSVVFFPRCLMSRRLGTTEQQVEKLDKYSQSYNHSNTDFCGCIGSPYFPGKERFKSNIFDSYMTVEFEGRNYSIITEYDQYLTQLYGDYMSLPPMEKRISHESYKWFWKN